MTENNRIEYKQKLTDDLEREIVAFLNYREGGIVYIGIDKNGEIAGLENSDSDQNKNKGPFEKQHSTFLYGFV